MHLRQALKLVGWVEEQQEARQNGFGAMSCSSSRAQFQGKDEMPSGVCMAWASGSQRSGITSAVWICVSIPTQSASTWTWLLLLKLAQRIPSSPVFVLSFHVPPCEWILLDLTRRKYKVQRVCCSCPTANPAAAPSAQPCSALKLLLSLYSTLRDVGNHHSARVFHREETRLLDGCECSLGHYVRQTLLQKGCSKLQAVRLALAQQFVLSSSWGGCEIQQIL